MLNHFGQFLRFTAFVLKFKVEMLVAMEDLNAKYVKFNLQVF